MSPARLATVIAVMALAWTVAWTPPAGGAASHPVVGRSAAPVTVPASPVGRQLTWLLGAFTRLPLSSQEIGAHFDGAFLAQVPAAELNEVLASLGPTGAVATLVQLSQVTPSALVAAVEFGSTIRYLVHLSVDLTGLISGLIFSPDVAAPRNWSQVDRQLAALAPGTSLLAARVNAEGTCTAVHSDSAGTPRPLGSMFKLFILGAVAQAVHQHKLSWSQKVTITAAIKTGGSGTLQNVPDGTTMTLQQVAVTTISVSDNTGADLMLQLVGRAAVEAQVRKWTAHPSLDIPFLTAKELFALKYDDFPALANRYLPLGPRQRAADLASTIDAVPASSEQGANVPRDVNTIEWFASADDLCRTFSGLATLEAEPGLRPLGTVLSTNDGGIPLNHATWPTIWFKGGSEPGLLTLGYLARDAQGHTFVVIALTEDPTEVLAPSATEQLLAVVTESFDLLH